MPIGKDSITKRVIGTTETPAQRLVKPAVKTAPKVEPKLKEGVLPTPTAPKGLETVEAAEPKTAPKTESKPKAPAKPKTVKPALPAEPAKTEPATAVMGSVSPEVVEKVTGHPETKAPKPVQITDDMPDYLL